MSNLKEVLLDARCFFYSVSYLYKYQVELVEVL